MSTHDPRDPHDTRREPSRISMVPDEAPDPVETRDPHSRPVPRTGTALLFAIPGLVLLVLGIGWMMSRESRDATRTFASQSPVATTGASGTDPEGRAREDVLNPPPEGPPVIGALELLADKDEYVGRPVELRAVKVLETAGTRAFWIGRLGNRNLVLLDRNAEAPGAIQAGEHLHISGTIERTPDEAQLRSAGLGKEEMEALDGEDVLIRATRVSPQPVTGPRDAPTR